MTSQRGRVIVLAVIAVGLIVAVVVAVLNSRDAPPTAGPSPSPSLSLSPAPTPPPTSAAPSPAEPTPTPNRTTPAAEPPPSPRPVPARTVRTEEPARDGALTFTVTGVEEGGTTFGKRKAKGRYVLVRLVVTNGGSEAVQFADTNQRGYDASGTAYTPDTEAAIARAGDGAYLTDLNPGTKIDGILVFDVPQGVDLTDLELHDRPGSPGIAVHL
ncbi:DUF4352 domain-containing protein [Tenggerimyces flavus]|uniref:DUF4352 domain-containing protein n=1 Tax=Tenggerimyces flavus TaxID=1708749 RepID=A0ABV7YJU8_9ACTN|nr:DUF4352 domain-containing protein [Tenggerimyces flavus]MBM7784605.1 hypothetical protein [Tenggerimyces flavus]